jgi:hypothetical protein
VFTQAELMDGIHELLEGKKSVQNCEKLAAIYTVLDHLYPASDETISKGYSGDAPSAESIPRYGDTDFLDAIVGKDPREMWLLMDELMETLAVINPRLYDGVMRKI